MARVSGLQIRKNGVVVSDYTTSFMYLIDSVVPGNTNGYVEDDALGNGVPWKVVCVLSAGYAPSLPVVTFAQVAGVWRMIWTWKVSGASTNPPIRIMYGVK